MKLEKLNEFRPFFFPESIAVIGISQSDQSMGGFFLRGFLNSGFRGELYSVGNSGGIIDGITIYPDLESIPGAVDYAIICVPKDNLLHVLDDCAAKGIKAVHIFTGGFSENSEEGRRAEEELAAEIDALGIRVIGPNCVGICCPASAMPLQPFPSSLIVMGKPGSVAFIAQSGRVLFELMEHGMPRCIHLSKMVGFGNACDLNGADLIEYLGVDPETEVIGAYLEGSKDGSRLFEAIRGASQTKPVVVLKGGRTKAGARTALSHTGSLAIPYSIWAGSLKQAGAIVVESIEEMADTLMAFQDLPAIAGNHAAIVTGIWAGGGGMSVTATDAFADYGIDVPVLTEQTLAELRDIFPPVGTILNNPLDITGTTTVAEMETAMQLAAADPVIDFLVVDISVTILWNAFSREEFHKVADALIDFKENKPKPLIVVSSHGIAELERISFIEKLSEALIPVYPTMERAARAIANVLQYQERGGGNHGVNT